MRSECREKLYQAGLRDRQTRQPIGVERGRRMKEVSRPGHELAYLPTLICLSAASIRLQPRTGRSHRPGDRRAPVRGSDHRAEDQRRRSATSSLPRPMYLLECGE